MYIKVAANILRAMFLHSYKSGDIRVVSKIAANIQRSVFVFLLILRDIWLYIKVAAILVPNVFCYELTLRDIWLCIKILPIFCQMTFCVVMNWDGLGYIKVAANIAPTAFQLCLDAEGYLVVYQGSRQSCANCFLL